MKRTVCELSDSEVAACWQAAKAKSVAFSMLSEAAAVLFVRSVLEGRRSASNPCWTAELKTCEKRILVGRRAAGNA